MDLEALALRRAEEQDRSESWRIEDSREERLREFKTRTSPGMCRVFGCSRQVNAKCRLSHGAKGMCEAHYRRWLRGLPLTTPLRTRLRRHR